MASSTDNSSEFEVFINEDMAGDCVAVMLRGASIVESEAGDLIPMLGLSPDAARMLAGALVASANSIDADR